MIAKERRKPRAVRAFVSDGMLPGETLIDWAMGWIGLFKARQRSGALIVTDRRVAFSERGWFSRSLATMPLEYVTALDIRVSPFSLFQRLDVATVSFVIDFRSGDRKEVARIYAVIEATREKALAALLAPDPLLSPASQMALLTAFGAGGAFGDEELAAATALLCA